MKRKLMGIVFVIMLAICGCGSKATEEPVKEPAEVEVKIYYVDETTGEIITKEVTAKEDILYEEIMSQLKGEKLLSEECDVQSVSINEEKKTMELDLNETFGEYVRGMGTTGSEQIIECVSRSYLEAYDCEEIRITEEGEPLDTGHTVLEGYISYK